MYIVKNTKKNIHIYLSIKSLGDEPIIPNEIGWYDVSIYVISEMG